LTFDMRCSKPKTDLGKRSGRANQNPGISTRIFD
jgi:hypothetical protein